MSFILLLLYLICTILRPQDWVPMFFNVQVMDILSISTFIFLLIERLPRGSLGFARVPQNFLMLGLFISILMSHIVHTYFAGLIDAFNAFLIIFILYYLVLNGIDSWPKFKFAILLIIVLVVILVPQGIYQLEHGYGWGGQLLTHDFHRGEYRINWIGIFNDPNDLALLFVIASGFVLAFIFGKVNFFKRLISCGILGSLFYGIYLTNSRGGMLALMTTVYFFFVRKTKRFVIGGIIGGAFAAAIFAIGPSRMGLISIDEASANNRVELWYGGILMLKANPVFGVGFNMFMEELPQTAHNSFILAAAELGMVGLFFWMGLIYSSFKGLSLIQAKIPQYRDYALGLQSSLIGFCAAAFFLSRLYVILPYLLFALAGSLMFISSKNDKTLDFRFTMKDARTTFLLSLGVLFMAYGLIKLGL